VRSETGAFLLKLFEYRGDICHCGEVYQFYLFFSLSPVIILRRARWGSLRCRSHSCLHRSPGFAPQVGQRIDSAALRTALLIGGLYVVVFN